MWLQKINIRDLCDAGTLLHLDYINVNILIVILFYTFARCCWEKLSKGYTGSPYYFSRLHVSFTSSKKFK